MTENPGIDEINEPKFDEATHSGGLSEEMVERASKPLSAAAAMDQQENMKMLMDVNLKLSVELGRSMLTVSQILDLQTGSVVELDRIAGEPVDIYVNDRRIARGDVVVVDDKFGVRITELINAPE